MSLISGMKLDSNILNTDMKSSLEPEGAYTAKRMKLLKEIFDFYARQKRMLGKTPTFDDINKNLNSLSMGEFLKFCSDFKVNQDLGFPAQQNKQMYQQAFKMVD